MKKIILSIALLFTTLSGFAHGVDISSMVFAEQKEGMWTLQVRASLDAFRKEVKFHFKDSPYNSPEAFKEQLLTHLQKNLSILVNGNQELVLEQPIVQLGHETVVYYNQIVLPHTIASLKISSSIFKDIYSSKMKLFILKKGADKQLFLLKKKNDYSVDLLINDTSFVVKKTDFVLNNSTLFSWIGLLSLTTLIALICYKNQEIILSKLKV